MIIEKETVLVTGGVGFIGSHTSVALQEAGYRVLIVDNLCNSDAAVLDAVAEITGEAPGFIEGDIRDRVLLDEIFANQRIDAVMHFAGLKAVGESTAEPLSYYDNNVNGSLQLLQAMQSARVRTIVFSSSATVYGEPQSLPLTECHPLSATNPYGYTKLVVEEMLANLHASEAGWRVARLRYFNPIGAHGSGRMGEAPQGTPNNLLPYIAQVATGTRTELQIFGADYDTPDGTGVRDFIHVLDLAEGHVAALDYCNRSDNELLTVNLGTGKGHSVLEIIAAFEQASGKQVPYKIVARRPGDIAKCWADTENAHRLMGWRASRTLSEMCEDAWRWEQNRGGRAVGSI